ncbi:hypothetical protein ADUPG1_007370, partial [Aduncisulcus paluster]
MSQKVVSIKLNEYKYRTTGPTSQGPSILLRFDKDKVVMDGSGSSYTNCDGEKFSSCTFSYISIPFTSAVPMQGIYILAHNDTGPPSLEIKFTHSDGKVTSRGYQFESHGKKDRKQSNGGYSPSANIWHYLPVDLSVVKCEINGRGTWKDYYPKAGAKTSIRQMFFVRGETARETELRELVEKKSTEMLILKSEFSKEGDSHNPPISYSDPTILLTDVKRVSGEVEDEKGVSKPSDVTPSLQKMLKGEGRCCFNRISLPFSLVSELKGVYICLAAFQSVSLFFFFTHSDGSKSHIKYNINEGSRIIWPKWYFLSIDLVDVVKCDIVGSRSEAFFGVSLSFIMACGLVFVRKESHKERLIAQKMGTCKPISLEKYFSTGSHCNPPISYLNSTIIPLTIDDISGCDDNWGKQSKFYNKTDDIQGVLRDTKDSCCFSHLYFPFSPPIPQMKGIYMCCNHHDGPRSLLFFITQSDSQYKVNVKEFSLPEPKNRSEWIFLPIDLPNVVHCEIRPKGTWTVKTSRRSYLDGLIFVRAETPKELQDRKARKKSISAAPSITSTLYSHKDRQHPPVALDSTQTIPLNVAGSIACDDSFCKESDRFDRSSTVRRMLRGECCASFSHLSIPFQDKCCPKGVYICFKQNKKTPAFRFVFTHSDGKQTFMKCAVEDLEHKHEWHFFPMDLSD